MIFKDNKLKDNFQFSFQNNNNINNQNTTIIANKSKNNLQIYSSSQNYSQNRQTI